MPDRELLRRYADDGSKEAFARIVESHSGMVYAVCLRVLGHAQDAEDAAQAVFLLLARKAGSVSGRANPRGWLFRAAELTARNVLKARRRQTHREEEAKAMQKAAVRPESTEWEDVRPHVDRALAGLPQRQRDAILLRYYQGMSEPEVAAAMAVPDALQQELWDKYRNNLPPAKGGAATAEKAK